MIDFHKEMRKALQSILPTYYEMTLTSNCKVPCISYMELTNVVENQGETIDYSKIVYQVKVWAKDIENLQKNAQLIDKALKPLGFKRIGSGELFDNQSTMMQKILTYEALGFEN